MIYKNISMKLYIATLVLVFSVRICYADLNPNETDKSLKFIELQRQIAAQNADQICNITFAHNFFSALNNNDTQKTKLLNQYFSRCMSYSEETIIEALATSNVSLDFREEGQSEPTLFDNLVIKLICHLRGNNKLQYGKLLAYLKAQPNFISACMPCLLEPIQETRLMLLRKTANKEVLAIDNEIEKLEELIKAKNKKN